MRERSVVISTRGMICDIGSEPRSARGLRDVFRDEIQEAAPLARLAVQLCKASVIAVAPGAAWACSGIADRDGGSWRTASYCRSPFMSMMAVRVTAGGGVYDIVA